MVKARSGESKPNAKGGYNLITHVDKELYDYLHGLAKEECRTVSAQIRYIILEYKRPKRSNS